MGFQAQQAGGGAMPDSSGPEIASDFETVPLPYTDAVKAKTDHLYAKVAKFMPAIE